MPRMEGTRGTGLKTEPEQATLKHATKHSDYRGASFALAAPDSYRLADNLW